MVRNPMKRWAFLLLVFSGVFFCSDLFAACIVVTQRGSMRCGPGQEYKAIAQVEAWDVFPFSGREGDWFLAGGGDASEQPGQKWIHKKLAQVIKDSCENVRRRAWAIKENPHWPKDVKDCILKGKIRIGMRGDEIKAAWGAPRDVRRRRGPWGVREQWVYGDIYYLNLEDGVLTSWSEK
jgi:hypothetical protein